MREMRGALLPGRYRTKSRRLRPVPPTTKSEGLNRRSFEMKPGGHQLETAFVPARSLPFRSPLAKLNIAAFLLQVGERP
jgi:hypothetical protein